MIAFSGWCDPPKCLNCPLIAAIKILPLVTVTTMMGTLYVSFACIYIPAAGLSIVSAPSLLFHSVFALTLSSYMQGTTGEISRKGESSARLRPTLGLKGFYLIQNPLSCQGKTKPLQGKELHTRDATRPYHDLPLSRTFIRRIFCCKHRRTGAEENYSGRQFFHPPRNTHKRQPRFGIVG